MIIKELLIYTSKLNEQIEFYRDVLALAVINKSENSISFKIGYSTLTFCYNDLAKPYHFAFNIPSNKEHEALAWLKQRVKVLTYQGNELVDFVNWNAKSIYFYDADKNVVEFIARKNLKIEISEPFNSTKLLGISEIGLSVNNVAGIYHKINSIRKTDLYFGNLEWFCAAGDELGLFIIIDQNKKGWMPCNDYAYTSDFKISGDINFEFVNGEIKVV